MRTADAVIIGGGCVGTSVLYHLTTMGCTDVVLLEESFLGSGSTSKAAGGIRMQHDDEVNTWLARRSLDEFTSFEELTGSAIDFKQIGYLFLVDKAADVAHFNRSVAQQQKLGIPTEVLDIAAINAMVPGLATEDLLSATFCPLDGVASPEAVVQGYASAARRNGAKIQVDTKVVEILAQGGRIVGVCTPEETISTSVVVVAAGVGCTDLVAPLGFCLPVRGEARTIYYSGSDAGVPNGAPLVVDFSTGFYFHREGPGLVFAGRERELEDLSEPATHRLPAIADIDIQTSWWGYYEVSPDHNAMIGRAPIEGLHYATGFSGHGFMQSPAVGEHVAQQILGLTPTLDLSTMSADRFAEGRDRTEMFVI